MKGQPMTGQSVGQTQTNLSATTKNKKVEMKSKFKSSCRVCKNTVYIGDIVFWFPSTHATEHYNCNRRKYK